MGDRGQTSHPSLEQSTKTHRFVPHSTLCLLPSGRCSWREIPLCIWGLSRVRPSQADTLTSVPETAGHHQHPPPCPTHAAPRYTSAGCYSRARHLYVEVPVAGQAVVRDQQLPKGERAG